MLCDLGLTVVDIIKFLLPEVVLLAETVYHVEGEGWDDDYGADVREDHLVGRACDIQNCRSIHFAHSVDQLIIVRRHRVSSRVQWDHHEAIEDSDTEQQKRRISEKDEVQRVVCAANHLQLVIVQVPQGFEPVGHVLDTVAPCECDFTAAVAPVVLLTSVNVGIVQDLLQHFCLLLALAFAVACECIWVELFFLVKEGKIRGVAPLLDRCLVNVDTVDGQATEEAGRFRSLETTIAGVKWVD